MILFGRFRTLSRQNFEKGLKFNFGVSMNQTFKMSVGHFSSLDRPFRVINNHSLSFYQIPCVLGRHGRT